MLSKNAVLEKIEPNGCSFLPKRSMFFRFYRVFFAKAHLLQFES